MIDSRTIEIIKQYARIEDVIGEVCELKKKGVEYTCLCPFHDDRHIGSFMVSPRKNLYKCFSCGEQGGPVDFVMKTQNVDFPAAIKWLGRKYGVLVDDSEELHVEPIKQRVQLSKPELLILPMSMVMKKLSTRSTLCQFLQNLPWDSVQRKYLERTLTDYYVGASKEGHTIFWQIDEQNRVRTGKMMRYKPDGHRDKESPGNFGWIHSRLAKIGWYDPDKYEKETCLFGLHLLNVNKSATVNIVESEKTAIIAAIAYSSHEHIWMACGGLMNLNNRTLAPLIEQNRYVVLYPDRDGIDKWKAKAEGISYERLSVNTDFIQHHWKPEDGEKADIADILIRLISRQQPTVEQMARLQPAIYNLIQTFECNEK